MSLLALPALPALPLAALAHLRDYLIPKPSARPSAAAVVAAAAERLAQGRQAGRRAPRPRGSALARPHPVQSPPKGCEPGGLLGDLARASGRTHSAPPWPLQCDKGVAALPKRAARVARCTPSTPSTPSTPRASSTADRARTLSGRLRRWPQERHLHCAGSTAKARDLECRRAFGLGAGRCWCRRQCTAVQRAGCAPAARAARAVCRAPPRPARRSTRATCIASRGVARGLATPPTNTSESAGRGGQALQGTSRHRKAPPHGRGRCADHTRMPARSPSVRRRRPTTSRPSAVRVKLELDPQDKRPALAAAVFHSPALRFTRAPDWARQRPDSLAL